MFQQRLYGVPNSSPYVKDSIGEAVVAGKTECVNPAKIGTKAAAHFSKWVEPGQSFEVRVRFLTAGSEVAKDPFRDFEMIMKTRIEEMNDFYNCLHVCIC
jgi:hypothetical protein